MKYICNDCQMAFDVPGVIRSGFSHEFGYTSQEEFVCPNCESNDYHFSRACRNEGCTNDRREDDRLCRDCRRALRKKFTDFVGGLSGAERLQLDDWMEKYNGSVMSEGWKYDED